MFTFRTTVPEWSARVSLLAHRGSGLAHFAPMRAPSEIDGARVLKVADLTSASPTGRTRHYGDGELQTGFARLALAQYAGDDSIYLLLRRELGLPQRHAPRGHRCCSGAGGVRVRGRDVRRAVIAAFACEEGSPQPRRRAVSSSGMRIMPVECDLAQLVLASREGGRKRCGEDRRRQSGLPRMHIRGAACNRPGSRRRILRTSRSGGRRVGGCQAATGIAVFTSTNTRSPRTSTAWAVTPSPAPSGAPDSRS